MNLATSQACEVTRAEIYTSQVQDVLSLQMRPLSYPRLEPMDDPYKRVILLEGCNPKERVIEQLKSIKSSLINKIEPYHWEGLGELFQIIIYLKKPVDLVAAEEGGAITFTLKNREYVPVPFAPMGPGPKNPASNLDVISLIEDSSAPKELTPAPNWLRPGSRLERDFGGRGAIRPVTLHHDRTPLDKVVEDLARQSGMNLLVDNNTLGRYPPKITIHVNNVTPEEALASLLSSQGLAQYQQGSVRVITSRDRAAEATAECCNDDPNSDVMDPQKPNDYRQPYRVGMKPAPKVRVQQGGSTVAYFPVNYVDPMELAQMIRRTPLEPAPLNVEAFDARGPQNSDTRLAEQNSMSEVRFKRDLVDAGRKGAIVSYGSPEANALVEDFINKVDLAPHQVVMEVTIYELSNTDISEFGLGQDRANPVTGQNQRGTDFQNGSLSGFFQNLANGGGLSVFYDQGAGLAKDFRAVMKMLIDKGKARILNRPTLATLDGQPAIIRVGDEEPIISRDPTRYKSDDFTSRIDYKLIGMSLYVVPRVDSDGNVVLAVNPVLTDKQSDSQVFNGDGSLNVSAPVISVREANTVVHVKSGEKVLIGGLMRQVQQENINRIPILSKLPLVGKLFQNESKNYIRQEILIEITPRVVADLPSGATPTTLPEHREKVGR